MNCGPTDPLDGIALTHDAIFDGRLKIAQPVRGHRAGTDAVLLAAATPPVAGLLIDVGAGVGTIGLAVAQRCTEARALLVERDPVFAALARRNTNTNALADRVSVVETDVTATLVRRGAGVRNESADVVVTNPPFFDAANARASDHPLKRGAHVIDGDLGGWVRACLTLLRPGGMFVMIHRADALSATLAGLLNRTGGISVRPVHAQADAPATRIVVHAIKGSRAPLSLLPALVLHDTANRFTPEAARLHAGQATLLP